MKAIILHTPRVDNSGARRDSGEEVHIGDDPQEIARDEAKRLISLGMAVDAAPKTALAPVAAKAPPAA